MDCARDGISLTALPLLRGYYRRLNTSEDIHKCGDASANCSATEDAYQCEHSSSGCRGGDDPSSPCMPTLDGPLCRLCANSTYFYRQASASAPAQCVPCRGSLGELVGVAVAALAFIILLLAVGTVAMLLLPCLPWVVDVLAQLRLGTKCASGHIELTTGVC